MSVSFANRRMLSLRQNKYSRRVGGHAPPQRHLKSRERGDERGGQRGRKRTSKRFAQRGCLLPRQKAANAATKEGANGGENARTSFLRSEGVVVPVLICLPVRQHLTQRPQFAPNTPH